MSDRMWRIAGWEEGAAARPILKEVEPVEVGYWCDYEGIYFTDPQEHMTEATWRKRDGGPLGHYGYECEGRKTTRQVVIVGATDE